MAKLTIAFGAILVMVGVGFWLALGRAEFAALHTAGLGAALLVCGVLANTEDAKRRMLWMHIAVTVGLIGFLVTGIRVLLQVVHGLGGLANPLGFYERVVSAVVCLIFVALCVRSFIAARRARLA